MKKILTIVLSAVIVASIAIGGTLAFLTAQTSALENVFQFDGIAIGLNEYSTYNAQDNTGTAYPTETQTVIPGTTVNKIPVVTVNEKSTACYVYVKVDNALNGTVANSTSLDIDTANWIPLASPNHTNIYRYKDVVTKSDTDTALPPVFTKVTFSGEYITMENIASLNDKKVTVQAFAHQSGGNDDNGDPLTVATIDSYADAFFYPAP